MGQITVFSGPERRRRWSSEDRLQILTKAFAPGVCASDVARRHEISTGLLYTWRKKLAAHPPSERLAVRKEHSAPLMDDLHRQLTAQLAKLSRTHQLAIAINYMLRRWPSFTRFLDDGRVCLSNNAAERALRCVALGRKAWLFCGSDRGGERAAVLYSLIQTARLNNVDPQAWLADVLARIAGHPAQHLDELLPWNWTHSVPLAKAA